MVRYFKYHNIGLSFQNYWLLDCFTATTSAWLSGKTADAEGSKVREGGHVLMWQKSAVRENDLSLQGSDARVIEDNFIKRFPKLKLGRQNHLDTIPVSFKSQQQSI